MGYLRNVYRQYWITFFHALIPAYVIERLFWQQRGMHVMMVVYCEIIYALTVAVLEVPSGILADRFGRKRMLCISAALSAAELILILYAHAFWQFALAVFLAGIGHAVFSGSENALLYDSLLIENKQGSFEKHLGRIRAIDFSASVVAALSGGMLASRYGLSLPYVISIGSALAAFCITVFLEEPPGCTAPDTDKRDKRWHVQQAFHVFRSSPAVLWYCLTGAILGACFSCLDEFWQLLAEGIGIPILYFGVLSALMLGLRIPGNMLAYKLKGKIRYSKILAAVTGMHAVGYVLIFVLQDVVGLVPVLLISAAAGVAEPLSLGVLHHHTESHMRATVESVYSLGMRGMTMAVGLAFGIISTRVSIFAGFLLLGGVCAFYLPVFLLFGKGRTDGV